MDDPDDLYTGFRKIDILGDKVRLREPREEDTPEYYRLVKNDAVLANIAWDGPENETEVRNSCLRFQREIRSGQSHHLIIESAGGPGVLGLIAVRFPRHPLQADIGYWLGEPFWNKGYMTEALRLMCWFAFKHLNSVRAYATVFVGNAGSRCVLENNGFTLDGTLRYHVYKRGNWLNTWFFTLLREEWQEFTPRGTDIEVRES